jgi:exopolysaccharide production protein ExoQ
MNKRQYESVKFEAVEKIFSVAMLFYITNAVMPFIMDQVDPSSPPQSKPIDLAVKATLYLAAFCFIAIRWPIMIESARNIKWIVVLLLIALASTAWSQDPSVTLWSSASLVATTAFGVYFGTRYTVPQQLRLLAWMCSLIVTLSFFFAIFLPQYGIEQSSIGAWQGVFIQRNGLARIMVLAVFVFLFVRPKRFHSLRWLGIAASLALLFLSRSATGMIVCAMIVATLPLYKLIRARFNVVIPVTLGIGLLLAGLLLVLMTDTAQAFQLVNRSSDLTGRTELWSALLRSISKRPWLGYGFSAFWQGTKGESGSVLDAAGWMAGYAHNGFLDLMLQLGVLGLTTFVVGYLVVWRRAIRFQSSVPGPVPVWLCTYLVFMLLYNLTESSLLLVHSIYWVLYTSTAVSLIPSSFRQLRTSPSDL